MPLCSGLSSRHLESFATPSLSRVSCAPTVITRHYPPPPTPTPPTRPPPPHGPPALSTVNNNSRRKPPPINPTVPCSWPPSHRGGRASASIGGVVALKELKTKKVYRRETRENMNCGKIVVFFSISPLTSREVRYFVIAWRLLIEVGHISKRRLKSRHSTS